MSRPPRGPVLPLVAAVLLGACVGSPPASEHHVEVPLLAYERGSAGVSEARWIELAGERVPALVGRRDLSLRAPLEASAVGGTLRARMGFVSGGRPGSPATRATFRVLLESEGSPGPVPLFERVSEAGPEPWSEAVEIDVPPGAHDGRSLLVEVVFDDSVPPAARRRAAWVAPRLVTRHPSPTASEPASRSGEPPNLLLITLDTTRQDVLGAYGGAASTPHLDRLAEQGVRFENVFSVAYGTTPSHSSLMASLPALEHGVYDNRTVLAGRHRTLAEVFHEAGYRTAAFVGARPLVRELGLAQGFDLYDDVLIYDAASGLEHFSRFERRADVTVDRFLDWLDEGGPPYLAWLHFYDPHQPYDPPESTAPAVDPTLEGRFRADGAPRSLTVSNPMLEQPELLAKLDVAARDRYRREIEFVDSQIGRVLDRIEERGESEQTLVVAISDHGESFLDRGVEVAFGHRTLFDEVTRLPLIVRWPRRVPRGARREALVANLDVAPTLVDLAGLAVPPTWTGTSLRSLLEHDGPGRERIVLEGALRREVAVRTPGAAVVRLDRQWCSRPRVRARLGAPEGMCARLFELTSDPEMRRPVPPDTEAARDLLQLAGQVLAAEAASAVSDRLQSEAHLEALRALGYVD